MKIETIKALRGATGATKHMDVMKMDLSGYTCIALASSAETGKERWTNLHVYYKRGAPARCRFVGVVEGWSVVPGERKKEQRMAGGTLGKVCRIFDTGSALGRAVIAEAEDTWETINDPGLQRTVTNAVLAAYINTPSPLERAARAVIDACDGDFPDFLRDELRALEQALPDV